MKIQLNALAQQLNDKLLPLYWIAGEEPLLMQEAAARIRQHAQKSGFSNTIIFEVDHRFNWNDFLGETQCLSLFGDQTLIELRLGDKKLSDAGRKILAEYLQAPASDKLVLLSSEKIDATTQKTQWFQAIEKYSGVIAIWPLSEMELQRWIESYFKANQLAASKPVIQLLMERGEGNLLAIKQDIEKLTLLYQNTTLEIEQVISVVADNSRFDIFALIDAALENDPKRVIKILKNLQQEGIEPILVLWALAREIRLLLTLCETQDPLTELSLKKHGIWPKRVGIIKSCMRRGSVAFFEKLLMRCTTIDSMIKGVQIGNVWDSLERVSLQLTGVKL